MWHVHCSSNGRNVHSLKTGARVRLEGEPSTLRRIGGEVCSRVVCCAIKGHDEHAPNGDRSSINGHVDPMPAPMPALGLSSGLWWWYKAAW